MADSIVLVLLLIATANSTPVLAHKLFGQHWSAALDGGRRWLDGRPLLGPSKTIRGLISALLATAMVSALLGQGIVFGLSIGACAMLGDLLSSFTKRRLGLASSSKARLIDQIPESLLPALFAGAWLGLTPFEIAAVVFLFFIAEVVLSPLLFRLGIRKRPF